MSFPIPHGRVDSLASTLHLPIDVLRLDLLHPVVSGNKWFKLKEYLWLARTEQKTILLTFGGAYSNHIAATAAAAQMEGFRSIGVIRGEEPGAWSHTLTTAKRYGMQLFFVTGEAYRQKEIPPEVFQTFSPSSILMIPEGGYGVPGMTGAKDILSVVDRTSYTHIVSAVGTGTTLAGLTEAAHPDQKIIGIPVLKNASSLEEEIASLRKPEKRHRFQLLQDYHFGGYAKQTSELISFMNCFYQQTGIPTDFVYTAKAFYGVLDLFKKRFFFPSDKILLVHTGGLQGNLSLPKGTLIFG